jgi:type II secretory pathway pseudopilin PulG
VRAVTLLEIVIAIVILTVVAAVTLPRFGRAAPAPDAAAEVRSDLKILRVAIERFRQDHGAFPAAPTDDSGLPHSAAVLVAQLTKYTDAQGNVADAPDATFCYGPYLRDGIPLSPLAPAADAVRMLIVPQATVLVPQPETGAGWLYCPLTGCIAVNSAQCDAAGHAYLEY